MMRAGRDYIIKKPTLRDPAHSGGLRHIFLPASLYDAMVARGEDMRPYARQQRLPVGIVTIEQR
jgi:hypothetical protein